MQDIMDYNPGWDKAVEEKRKEEHLKDCSAFKCYMDFAFKNNIKTYINSLYHIALKWLDRGYEEMLEMLIDDGRIFEYV